MENVANNLNARSPFNADNRAHYSDKTLFKQLVQGFTLVELMVTISVAGIIIAIAMPNFSEFIIKMRVDSEVTQIQRFLLIARNAAINSGQNTQFCPLRPDNTCKPTLDWSGRVGVISSNGLIKVKEAVKTGDKIKFSMQSITYDARGRSNNAALTTFSYCPKNNTDNARGISLSISGRSYLSTDINGDGKDQDRTGANINCL